MVSTYSPSLRLDLMTTGDQSGNWGAVANLNLGTLLEQAIAGHQAIAMGDVNYTLTTVNGAVDEARNLIIVLTGAHTAIRNLTIPSVEKFYVIRNATTGGFAVNVKTSGGATLALPSLTTTIVYTDGTDSYKATASYAVATDAVVGDIVGDVVGDVIGSASLNLLKSGDNMSGDLQIEKANPAIFLNKDASGSSSVIFGYMADLPRWGVVFGDGSAESGVSTDSGGSDFEITRWRNDGVFLGYSLVIDRETGEWTITGDISGSATVSDALGDLRSLPMLAKTAPYSLTAADAGKCISTTVGSVTLPAATMLKGDVVRIFNNSSSAQTINISPTVYLAGTATSGSRTLAQRGIAEILCITSTVSGDASDLFVISGTGLT